MPENVVRALVVFSPTGSLVEVTPGSTIAEAAQRAGLLFETPCGGGGACGKCLVKVTSGDVLPANDMEQELLSSDRLEAGYRLACQAVLGAGRISVEVLPETMNRTSPVLETGFSAVYPLNPGVVSIELKLAGPEAERSGGDWERVAEAAASLTGKEMIPNISVVRDLPGLIREFDWQAELVTVGGRPAAIRPMPPQPLCGVAVDIGTTTVVAYLMDLREGVLLATESMVNPQVAFGSEIISRVTYALEHSGGRRELRRLILEGLNGLIEKLCRRSRIQQEDIFEVSIVGNTTMHHLFLGIDPACLVKAPYVSGITSPLEISSIEAGLNINPWGSVYMLPCVGAFLGADAVGVVLATEFHKGIGPGLAIDIGTNGEIVARLGEDLVACSAAAGPAFEGGQISMGMRAAPGAVEHLRVSGDHIEVEVIGGAAPVGICGSGLMDAVAFLIREGYLDGRGRLNVSANEKAGSPEKDWPSAHRTVDGNLRLDRGQPLVGMGEDGPEFRLAPAEMSGHGRAIRVTQKDIRQLQLAKGAIRASVRLLEKTLGLTSDTWEEVLLAGAFGSFVSKESCLTIGLLPGVDPARIKAVGNAAGSGARLALLSLQARHEAGRIARRIRPFNLARHPDFEEEFFHGMMFGNMASWEK